MHKNVYPCLRQMREAQETERFRLYLLNTRCRNIVAALWFLLDSPGCSWLLLPPPGSSWLLLAPPTSSYLLLAPACVHVHGCVCSCPSRSGSGLPGNLTGLFLSYLDGVPGAPMGGQGNQGEPWESQGAPWEPWVALPWLSPGSLKKVGKTFEYFNMVCVMA